MKLETIAHLRGLGPTLLLGVDSRSNPGKVICNFVRMETIVFENDGLFDTNTFLTPHAANDLRMELVVESVKRGRDL